MLLKSQQFLKVEVRALLFALLLSLPNAFATDWPHWRGPSRDDKTPESSGWREGRWIDEKPLWQAQVDEGSTSPLVVSNRLYVLGWKDQKDHLRCLNANGDLLWNISYKCPRYGRFATGDEDAYSGPTATPELDSSTQYLFTLSCDGDLNCFNVAVSGQQVWHINLYDRFNVGQRPASKLEPDDLRDYGYTTAPCVQGDWVLVEVGSSRGGVMAFDKRTGALRWVSEYRGPPGHTGGLVPIEVEGVPCVAVLTFNCLVVLRLDPGNEGKTVATYPWTSAWANNVQTPAVQNNCILIGSWHTHKSLCKLRITLRGAERVWEKPFSSFVGSPVIQGKRVYMAGERLLCLDWETGERVWAGGAFGYGGACILTSDAKLIVWSNLGRVSLVADSESTAAYSQLARVSKVFEGTHAWPHPVLADARLYLKDSHGNLKAFRVPQ